MFTLVVLVVLCTALNGVTTTIIDDLESKIGNKHCIEASVLTSASQDDPTFVLDKDSVLKSALYNISMKLDSFEKGATSRMHELAQYNDLAYTYELISEKGPAHNKVFRVRLRLGDETYEVEASSLKEAKRLAAMKAIEETQYGHPPTKIPDTNKVMTPTVVLNNVGLKLGIHVTYYLITDNNHQAISSYSSGEPYGKTKKSYFEKLNHSIYHPDQDVLKVPSEEPQLVGPFTVKVKVGDDEFVGFGHTVQGARHDAAFKALEFMKTEALYKDNVCSKEESAHLCKQKKDNLKSPITRVHEMGQKHNLAVEFFLKEESGPAHKKIFVTQCQVGSFVTEGQGKSKKESKKNAAISMLDNLRYLPEITDGSDIINGLKTKKKRKKKQKRMIKPDEHKLGGLQDMLSFVWASPGQKNVKMMDSPNQDSRNVQDKNNKQETSSLKDNLLEVSNALGFEVHFSDLGQKGGFHLSLLSLGINPSYICLGKGFTRDGATDDAALHGYRFLYKLGFLDKLDTGTVKSEEWVLPTRESTKPGEVAYEIYDDDKQ